MKMGLEEKDLEMEEMVKVVVGEEVMIHKHLGHLDRQ